MMTRTPMEMSAYRRRYRFLRSIGAGPVTACFVALLNELSDLPSDHVGFMSWVARIPPEG